MSYNMFVKIFVKLKKILHKTFGNWVQKFMKGVLC